MSLFMQPTCYILVVMITVLGTSVVLPIAILSMQYKQKLDYERNRKEIILAALEKNADVDIEDLIKKMSPTKALIKEKLLRKLQWGVIMTLLGIGFLTSSSVMGGIGGFRPDFLEVIGIGGAALIAIGISLLFTYRFGKKMLAREIEAEEKNMQHV